MEALLGIYALGIVASTALAAGLSLLGIQLAARDRAMQTMCVGQGAMFGVLVGIGLVQLASMNLAVQASLPIATGLLCSGVTFMVSEKIVTKRSAAINTHFAALFVALLASGHFISALVPSLESHMAQKYFGDLATLSQAEFGVMLGLGMLLIISLKGFERSVTRDSFQIAILGHNALTGRSNIIFALSSLVVICICVQEVGFMFTVACLFLPTSLLSFRTRIGLGHHTAACAVTAAIACVCGFIISLWQTRLPTVPCIVTMMVLISSLLYLVQRRRVVTRQE